MTVHAPTVVGLCVALAGWVMPPLSKLAIVGAGGTAASFAIAAGWRRLPGTRHVSQTAGPPAATLTKRCAPRCRSPSGKGPNARSIGGCRRLAKSERLGGSTLIGGEPLGRSARPLPHACRPFVSWSCHRAAAPSKVQPSKTSRHRCNPKERHREHHPASPLQLHPLSRRRLHLRLPASRRANRRRLRPAVPMRRSMPVRRAVPMRHRRQLRAILSRTASSTCVDDAACEGRRTSRVRRLNRIASDSLTSRVVAAPLPHEGACP